MGGQTHYYFFHTEEKLFNMKYICGKYLSKTTVLKMHKFCHSGAKPFSKGKDVSKTNYTLKGKTSKQKKKRLNLGIA